MEKQTAFAIVFAAFALPFLVWCAVASRRNERECQATIDSLTADRDSELETETCPWCGEPRIDDGTEPYITWKCRSSVGVNTGDPIQTSDCITRQIQKELASAK